MPVPHPWSRRYVQDAPLWAILGELPTWPALQAYLTQLQVCTFGPCWRCQWLSALLAKPILLLRHAPCALLLQRKHFECPALPVSHSTTQPPVPPRVTPPSAVQRRPAGSGPGL